MAYSKMPHTGKTVVKSWVMRKPKGDVPKTKIYVKVQQNSDNTQVKTVVVLGYKPKMRSDMFYFGPFERRSVAENFIKESGFLSLTLVSKKDL